MISMKSIPTKLTLLLITAFLWLLTLTAYLSRLNYMPIHSTMQGLELHQPYHYIQEADPGAVGAGLFWLKVSTATISRRNDANSAWVAMGAPGTVTSVGLTMPGAGLIFDVTGSPVTSSGTLAVDWLNQSPNSFLAGPGGGGPDVPSFRSLIANDLPTMVGDSGGGGTKGAVPAPGAGDAAANFFLNADGTFKIAHPLTTKGDLFGFSTVSARMPVGSDKMVLHGLASETNGLKYDYISRVKKVTTLTYAGTTNTDAATGDVFLLTLTGSPTLANPTNAVDGQRIEWRILQNGAGGFTPILDTKFRIPSSTTPPLAWVTTANKMNLLVVEYNLVDDKFDVVAFIPGY